MSTPRRCHLPNVIELTSLVCSVFEWLFALLYLTFHCEGVVVECQQERSQQMNKEIALRTLRAKLYQQIIEKQLSQEQSARKLQVRKDDWWTWKGCFFVGVFLWVSLSNKLCLRRRILGVKMLTLLWKCTSVVCLSQLSPSVEFSGNEWTTDCGWKEENVAEITQKAVLSTQLEQQPKFRSEVLGVVF